MSIFLWGMLQVGLEVLWKMKNENKKFHSANIGVMLQGMKINHHHGYWRGKHQIATNDNNICFYFYNLKNKFEFFFFLSI
jgi:uncharacterized membrane protein YfbV (UPF0208 family)